MDFVRETSGGCILRVLATPGASRSALGGLHDGRLKVFLNAPPERGRANKALCKLLAGALGIRPAQVRILSGQTSREKEVFLERVRAAALDAILR